MFTFIEQCFIIAVIGIVVFGIAGLIAYICDVLDKGKW